MEVAKNEQNMETWSQPFLSNSEHQNTMRPWVQKEGDNWTKNTGVSFGKK